MGDASAGLLRQIRQIVSENRAEAIFNSEPLKALANLLMGEIFAPLESFLAALHGLDEAGFFLEIARQSLLHQLVGIAALGTA